jgi:hypothetical protein
VRFEEVSGVRCTYKLILPILIAGGTDMLSAVNTSRPLSGWNDIMIFGDRFRTKECFNVSLKRWAEDRVERVERRRSYRSKRCMEGGHLKTIHSRPEYERATPARPMRNTFIVR